MLFRETRDFLNKIGGVSFSPLHQSQLCLEQQSESQNADAIINVFTIDRPPYTLPVAVFYESDPLAIGGAVWSPNLAFLVEFNSA
ncbi:MAG: hypothetical protein EAX95_15855 [Candidatus Thorarchaeota archaeon]|nr:hypothetical protein [Candidatus Thorarchaeota archaeon]